MGVATGYRWYLPAGSGLGSLLLSAWNAQSLFLFGDELSFAWGGTMAMRRVDFENLEIRRRWRGGVSDDGSVTTAVRSHGRRIQFVPRCLVASRGDASLSDVLEFTNRQIILTRVYMPRAWREIVALTLYFCALFALVAALLYRAFAQQALPDGVVSLLLPGMAFAMVLQCWLQTAFAMRILPQHRDELRRLRWAYLGVMPLVAPLALWNVIVSCFSRRIVWRGSAMNCSALIRPSSGNAIFPIRARFRAAALCQRNHDVRPAEQAYRCFRSPKRSVAASSDKTMRV